MDRCTSNNHSPKVIQVEQILITRFRGKSSVHAFCKYNLYDRQKGSVREIL